MRRFLLLFSACMLFSTQVFASGFAVHNQGSKAMGMANAFVAVADDASAAWYNPAALAFQDGVSITAGGQFVMSGADFTPDNHGTATFARDKGNSFIPFGYLSYNSDALPVTLGLAINSPFGLASDWTGSGAPFTGAGAEGSLTFTDLKLVNINPVAAYKVNESLSVAAGVSYYYVKDVAFNNNLLTQAGDGSGWGANVALFYKGDNYDIGVTYRSQAKLKLSGTATALTNLNAGFLTGAVSDLDVSITLPDALNVGVAFDLNDDWLLSLQYNWVNWKTFDSLDFNYASAVLTGVISATSASGTTSVAQNWRAASSFSVGAAWDYSDRSQIRFGYGFEQTPVTDADFSPRTADNDRHLLALGYGYNMSDATTIDLAYNYIMIKDRNQTASSVASARNGLYKTTLSTISAAVSHRF